MVLLGVFGIITSAKYYERFRSAASHVGRAMEKLRDVCPDVDLDEIENKGKAIHDKRYPRMSKLRLHWLWQWLHGGIILVGLINVAVICFKRVGTP